MSRPVHYISDALHGLVYISNLWSPFNEMVETRNLRPQKKGFVSRTFVKKSAMLFSFLFFSFLFFSFLFFSFLFFSVLFFLSFFLTFFFFFSSSFFFFFFFLIENEQCEKWFFNRVLVPLSPLRGQVFAIFFLAIKKKNKNGLSAYIPPSGKCESTYLCTRVCETNLYLFI